MSGEFLVYGSYGYTGELIVREAVAAGLRPILAGRDAAKLAAQAKLHGLAARNFALDDPRAVDVGIAGCAMVSHCAGPFIHTARAMAEGCLRNHVHYTDIAGEFAVFEMLAGMNDAAADAGVMLLPGSGFDVVPSDCLAVVLKQKLPTANTLRLAFHYPGRPSHGSQLTVIEGLAQSGMVRRDGKLEAVPHGWKERSIDFGDGIARVCMTIPWGDVSTAYHSTGIPNIEVYMAAPAVLRLGSRLMRHLGWLIGARPVQVLVRRALPAGGPSETERAKGYTLLWGEVSDESNSAVQARLSLPDTYTFTAQSTVHIAKKILDGQVIPGFQTPAKMYGPDLVMELPGVNRT